jgi:hypothetical protein
MTKRNIARRMSDAYTKARSPAAKPSRVSLIKGGVKYKSGCAPVRVCPAGAGGRLGQAILAKPV